MVAFRDTVCMFMPMDMTAPASRAQLTTVTVSEQSLQEHTCAAMMSYFSTASAKAPKNSCADRGEFTPKQHTACILRLKAQSQANLQTICSLQRALSSAGGSGCGHESSCRQGGCALGSYLRPLTW